MSFPLLKMDVEPGDRVGFVSDIHFPVHDPRLLAIVLEVFRREKVTHVIAGGDVFHGDSLSEHDRDYRYLLEDGTLQQEAEAGLPFLQDLRRLVGPKNALILPGNHEERVYRHVNKFPGLAGVLEWYTPYESALTGWTIAPRAAGVMVGSLLVAHGHQFRGALAKESAKTVLANYPGQNSLYGHTHRIDAKTTPTEKDVRQVQHGAWTTGYLSRPEAHENYALQWSHAWQHGFAIIDVYDLNPTGRLGFTVNQARFLQDRRKRPVLNFLGRTYR